MLKRISFLLLVFLLSTSTLVVGQNDSIVETEEKAPKEKTPKEKPPKEMFYGPTVGLGVGMFKF